MIYIIKLHIITIYRLIMSDCIKWKLLPVFDSLQGLPQVNFVPHKHLFIAAETLKHFIV